jgi:predicted MFS family arabinose efflux permease
MLAIRVPDVERGPVAASVNGFARGASICALVLGGWLGGLLGPAGTFFVLGAGCLAVVVVLAVRVLPP